ncbi:SpoIIE family protein phosphatase [Chryseomicrobium sp. FSL W7-1435]|uniref:SpoIIE family protein phosphatase n=1 Tax=Chryseomicrobium sp. FSL W7-1435 TaxID=2921704 RepID=UPI00315AD4BE
MRFISLPQPWHHLAAWRLQLAHKEKWVVTLFFLWLSFFCTQVVLFDQTIPFFLPVWALVSIRYPDYKRWTIIGALFGALTLGVGQGMIHFLQVLLFQVLRKVPLLPRITLSMLIVQVTWQWVSYGQQVPLDVWLAIGYEVVLSVIVAMLLFRVFLPLPKMWVEKWTTERIVGLMMLFALMLTGMQYMLVGYFSVPIILLQLSLLVAGAVGGAALSTPIAVAAGLLLGLSTLSYSGMMAVYALTGLFVGIHRRAGRLWQTIAMLGVLIFFRFYDTTLPIEEVFLSSTVFASLLFFAVPKGWIQQLQQWVQPKENRQANQRFEWMEARWKRHMREAQSFFRYVGDVIRSETAAATQLGEQTLPVPCQSCYRKASCYEKGEMGTLLDTWQSQQGAAKRQAELAMMKRCIKPKTLVQSLEAERQHHLLSLHYDHARQLFASKLDGLGEEIEHFMEALQVPAGEQEDQLFQLLRMQHVPIWQMDILSNERGQRHIRLSLSESCTEAETQEIVALVSSWADEPMECSDRRALVEPFEHQELLITSAIAFTISADVATSSKNGTIRSGDQHFLFPVHDGLFAVLLADGMGHGELATKESGWMMECMQQALWQRVDPETALHFLHYITGLRMTSDVYATMDLALIDLQLGRLHSWKAGAMSTYIVRGGTCTSLNHQTAPLGFSSNSALAEQSMELKHGDQIWMISDGIFQETIELDIQEQQYMKWWTEKSPTAAEFMEWRSRYFGVATDDQTVICLHVSKRLPSWSLFTPRQVTRVVN